MLVSKACSLGKKICWVYRVDCSIKNMLDDKAYSLGKDDKAYSLGKDGKACFLGKDGKAYFFGMDVGSWKFED